MDNFKRNKLHIVRVPERKEIEKGEGGVLFDYRMADSFPKWGKF